MLPPPRSNISIAVNVASASPWPRDTLLASAQGTRVTAFAEAIDYPRSLHVLPNGDVLVDETRGPPAAASRARPERLNRRAGDKTRWF